MSRDINPFALRMPPDLRAQIEVAAKASGRSMNAEIVARLQLTMGGDGRDRDELAKVNQRMYAVEVQVQVLLDAYRALTDKEMPVSKDLRHSGSRGA